MSEESKALTLVGSGALAAHNPQAFVDQASRIATALASVIKSRELSKRIGNKEHVYVEGWTTLAAMLGMTPREVSTLEAPPGVYVSTYELVNAEGRVIGRASAECGRDDEVDNFGNLTWADRPAYARRSMAQTRATSKVCRVALSWIMTLAGYAATPAEEMDGVTETQSQPQQKGPWDGSAMVKFGKFKGKKWADVPADYLVWILENMKPPAQDFAKLETQRRAKPENENQAADVVEAEVVEPALFP